jgi:hypothetical protein
VKDRANLLFIGLPGSGKTTFLAALWHVLFDGASATTLKLTTQSGERTYLNQIADEWRKCSTVTRTNLHTEQVLVLHLEGVGFGAFDLSIPDPAGEAFKQQLEDRRMTKQHDTLIEAATGVTLFLHPDVLKPTPLTTAQRVEAELLGLQDDSVTGSHLGEAHPWSPEMLPTQVKLVELLQFLIERTERKMRVALVVSAWDLVENLRLSPCAFVARELPLLQQFLEANDDLLEYSVFGISAQGGDISDANAKDSLLELDDATKRIKVVHDRGASNDITLPLAWLLRRP